MECGRNNFLNETKLQDKPNSPHIDGIIRITKKEKNNKIKQFIDIILRIGWSIFVLPICFWRFLQIIFYNILGISLKPHTIILKTNNLQEIIYELFQLRKIKNNNECIEVS
jgi:hypothetical protein